MLDRQVVRSLPAALARLDLKVFRRSSFFRLMVCATHWFPHPQVREKSAGNLTFLLPPDRSNSEDNVESHVIPDLLDSSRFLYAPLLRFNAIFIRKDCRIERVRGEPSSRTGINRSKALSGRLSVRTWEDERMTLFYAIGGIVSLGLFVYLLVALLKPEVFS